MTHSHHPNKAEKKKPMHTAKEKRTAKRMKKQHAQEQQGNEMNLHLTQPQQH
jgi:hypothetical protein